MIKHCSNREVLRWGSVFASIAMNAGCGGAEPPANCPSDGDCAADRSSVPEDTSRAGAGGSGGDQAAVEQAGGNGPAVAGSSSTSDEPSGGGNADASPGGAAGATGDGNAAEPCAVAGERRCHGAAQALVSECVAGQWLSSECPAGTLCDSRDGQCASIVPGCETLAPGSAFCQGTVRRVCGTDLVTSNDVPCAGACRAGA